MLKSAVANSSAQTISQHGFAEVVLNLDTKQRSLHSLINFKKKSVITKFEAQDIFSTPNYLTVQVGLNKHITLFPNFLQYINHSCNPNVFFDTQNMELVALSDIEPFEEFRFFYPSTELNMSQPFVCFCLSNDCLKNINGAGQTPKDILRKYRLTDFIYSMVINIK